MSVPPDSSLRRYCRLLVTGCDMNRGPQSSSSVGRLIAWTLAQKWPLPLPRSRYQRPPGHGSMVIGMATPSRRSLKGPSCSRSAAKVASRLALTWISCVTSMVSASRLNAGELMVVSCLGNGLLTLTLAGLRPLLDAGELVLPMAFEGARPVMQRSDGAGVGAVEHLAAVAANFDQADFEQNAKVLRNGRL